MVKKKPAARPAKKVAKAGKGTAKKAAPSKAAARKPVATKAAARKSVATKSGATKSVATKSGATKSVATKSAPHPAKFTARSLAVKAAGLAKRPAAVPERPAKKLKSPFKKRELDSFRAALMEVRYARIGDKESREKEALKAAGQDVSVDHMADFGSDSYEQEFTLGLLEQDIETLRDINDALVRIKEGAFGLCEECEEPVAKARLKAIPHARLCVPCKMKEE